MENLKHKNLENKSDIISKTDWLDNILDVISYHIIVMDIYGNLIRKSKNISEYIKNQECFKDINDNNIKSYLKKFDIYTKFEKKLELEDFPIYRTINNGESIEDFIIKYKFKVKHPIRHAILSSFPIKENGVVIGAIVIFIDVTNEYNKKLKMKKEMLNFFNISKELKSKCNIINILRNKEQEHSIYLRYLLNNVTDGVILSDSAGNFSLCNKSASDLLGIEFGKKIDLGNLDKNFYISDIETDEDWSSIYKRYDKDNKALEDSVLKFRSKLNNNIRYIKCSSNHIKSPEGNTLYTMYFLKDVTESKINEIKSKEQARIIEYVINNIDVPIALLSYPDLEIKLINKKCKEFINAIEKKDEEFFVDKNLKEIFQENINKNLREAADRCGREKKEIAYSPFPINIGGTNRYYKVKLLPYMDVDGNVKNIQVHGLDITEEVKNNMELEEITRVKDEFFTVISHELRTPITIIRSSLQLAYDIYNSEITKNIDKVLGRINQNSSRLLKLINNILDISTAEAGFLSLNYSKFDIVETTEYIVNSVNLYAESKCIELIFDTNEEEGEVELDRDKYEKVLLNLLSNAIKYTPEGKRILVTLTLDSENLVLSVKDEGVGIPSDKIEFIFDRFAQINTSLSRSAEGTGLGLALVKKILEILNGEIRVESKVGVGSNFIIKIKRKPSSEQKNEEKYPLLRENIKEKINIEFSDIN